MNVTVLYQIFVFALATAAISVTISKTNIFAFFRVWIASKSEWFGELFSCAYCLSHWVAIFFVAMYRPAVIEQWLVLDFVVSVFVIVALSALVSGTLMKLIPFGSYHTADVREIGSLPTQPPSRDYSRSSLVAK